MNTQRTWMEIWIAGINGEILIRSEERKNGNLTKKEFDLTSKNDSYVCQVYVYIQSCKNILVQIRDINVINYMEKVQPSKNYLVAWTAYIF